MLHRMLPVNLCVTDKGWGFPTLNGEIDSNEQCSNSNNIRNNKDT